LSGNEGLEDVLLSGDTMIHSSIDLL